MPSEHAFVDTTVLADALLKPGHEQGQASLAALRAYKKASTPTYALKEFQLGPLRGCTSWLKIKNPAYSQIEARHELFEQRRHQLDGPRSRAGPVMLAFV